MYSRKPAPQYSEISHSVSRILTTTNLGAIDKQGENSLGHNLHKVHDFLTARGISKAQINQADTSMWPRGSELRDSYEIAYNTIDKLADMLIIQHSGKVDCRARIDSAFASLANTFGYMAREMDTIEPGSSKACGFIDFNAIVAGIHSLEQKVAASLGEMGVASTGIAGRFR